MKKKTSKLNAFDSERTARKFAFNWDGGNGKN